MELTACHLFSSYSWLWPWAWRSDVFNILPDMNTFRNSNGILGCIIESNEARNGIIEKVLNESHFSKEISWPLFLQIKCNLERTMNTFFRVRNTIEKHTTLCRSTHKMIECHIIVSTEELGTFKLIEWPQIDFILCSCFWWKVRFEEGFEWVFVVRCSLQV